MNRFVCLVLALVVGLLLGGCASVGFPTNGSQATDMGLLGPHELIKNNNGRYFSQITVTASSKDALPVSISSNTIYHFQWQWKNHSVVHTELPNTIFLFILEEISTPTVEFIFDEGWLADNKWKGVFKKDNPNIYLSGKRIDSGVLKDVTVRISPQDYAKEFESQGS